VLSNVDRERPAGAVDPQPLDETTAVEVPRQEPSAGPLAAPEARPLEIGTSRRRPPDDDGHWHWLWVLGGVATVLLVPIAVLLTRATRSS
jgi:hypothetical protein